MLRNLSSIQCGFYIFNRFFFMCKINNQTPNHRLRGPNSLLLEQNICKYIYIIIDVRLHNCNLTSTSICVILHIFK